MDLDPVTLLSSNGAVLWFVRSLDSKLSDFCAALGNDSTSQCKERHPAQSLEVHCDRVVKLR